MIGLDIAPNYKQLLLAPVDSSVYFALIAQRGNDLVGLCESLQTDPF